VFVTRDGLVKILDFGLATSAPAIAEEQITGSTVTQGTEPGTVLGTVGYMSPEQVRGEAADPRTDIFALGCILYEMLAGRRAFTGDTAAEALAAMLRDQPADLSNAAAPIPPKVDVVVRRCLEKDREQRFQSARDLAFALRELLSGAVSVRMPIPHRKLWFASRRRIIAGGGVVAILAVLAAVSRPDVVPLFKRFGIGTRSIRSLVVLSNSGCCAINNVAWEVAA
jgi:serine/threonine protein kinase